MAFSLTALAKLKSQEASKEPQLVLQIDGVPTVYGTTALLEYIRIGDDDLFIDGSWVIGGLRSLDGQEALLSVGNNSGTSTKITQTLDHEKGRGSSVQSLTMGLVDKDGKITELISPGFVVEDLLGRRAKVYLGFNDTGFKRDFIPVFKGIIDDIKAGAGLIKLQIGSPEQKKRQEIFQKATAKLDGAINNSATTIQVDTTLNFLPQGVKPDGNPETAFKTYIRIEDEIIEYTGIASGPPRFTGCVRGALGTTAVSHDDETDLESFYRLGPDNGVDLALKVMLGGWQGPFITGVEVTNFVNISPTEPIANAIWFDEIDVKEEYGLTPGDYVTSAGATNGANNFSMKTIAEIVVTDNGSYIVMNGVSLVPEFDTAATLSFRSQYDTLPAGAGLAMIPDDVDVEQHTYLKNLILSNYTLDIYSFDTEKGKDFIEQELYVPGSMFSVPRKARSSVQASIGPIPSSNTVTLDETNVTKPDKLIVQRSLGKNFYNNVVYNFDQEPLDKKFLRSIITVAADSLTRIPVGVKTLKIESRGLRTANQAETTIDAASTRRLNRYKFAAEYLENVQVSFGIGFNIEIGDLVILDGEALKLSDSKYGMRGMIPRLFEVYNKTIDIKSGNITLNMVDSAYSATNRYGLVGPASTILTGLSTTEFILAESPYFSYFATEGEKWARFKRPFVYVRNYDGSVRETRRILQVSGNHILLETPLSFTPLTDYIMELSSYNDATEQIKLLYAFMRDTTFLDGRDQYKMI